MSTSKKTKVKVSKDWREQLLENKQAPAPTAPKQQEPTEAQVRRMNTVAAEAAAKEERIAAADRKLEFARSVPRNPDVVNQWVNKGNSQWMSLRDDGSWGQVEKDKAVVEHIISYGNYLPMRCTPKIWEEIWQEDPILKKAPPHYAGTEIEFVLSHMRRIQAVDQVWRAAGYPEGVVVTMEGKRALNQKHFKVLEGTKGIKECPAPWKVFSDAFFGKAKDRVFSQWKLVREFHRSGGFAIKKNRDFKLSILVLLGVGGGGKGTFEDFAARSLGDGGPAESNGLFRGDEVGTSLQLFRPVVTFPDPAFADFEIPFVQRKLLSLVANANKKIRTMGVSGFDVRLSPWFIYTNNLSTNSETGNSGLKVFVGCPVEVMQKLCIVKTGHGIGALCDAKLNTDTVNGTNPLEDTFVDFLGWLDEKFVIPQDVLWEEIEGRTIPARFGVGYYCDPELELIFNPLNKDGLDVLWEAIRDTCNPGQKYSAMEILSLIHTQRNGGKESLWRNLGTPQVFSKHLYAIEAATKKQLLMSEEIGDKKKGGRTVWIVAKTHESQLLEDNVVPVQFRKSSSADYKEDVPV